MHPIMMFSLMWLNVTKSPLASNGSIASLMSIRKCLYLSPPISIYILQTRIGNDLKKGQRGGSLRRRGNVGDFSIVFRTMVQTQHDRLFCHHRPLLPSHSLVGHRIRVDHKSLLMARVCNIQLKMIIHDAFLYLSISRILFPVGFNSKRRFFFDPPILLFRFLFSTQVLVRGILI